MKSEMAFLELAQAMTQRCCPLCRVLRMAGERYLWSFLYGLSTDPPTRKRLDRSLGFCHDHAVLMGVVVEERELVSGATVALLYESVVAEYQERVLALPDGITGIVENRWRPIWSGPRSTHEPESGTFLTSSAPRRDTGKILAGCLACEVAARRARSEVHALLRMLGQETYRELYAKSDGLCNPHLTTVLRAAASATRGLLLEDHGRRMEVLRARLRELHRKQAGDVTEGPTAQEQGSWREALWRFTGVSWDTPLVRRGDVQ